MTVIDIELDIEMNYAIEDIARTLKKARERKGLSQRELSTRSKVRQYQISKFENGAVDLRLSSLIELARSLDLELTLVPRKSISAVKSIMRSSEPKVVAAPALKEIKRTVDAIKKLRTAFPDQGELIKLQNNFQAFKNFPGINNELQALNKITKRIREIQKLTETSRKLAGTTAGPLPALQQANDAAQALRNQLAHTIQESSLAPRPAYSLDEDDDG